MLVIAVTVTTLTDTRGLDGKTAAIQSSGSQIEEMNFVPYIFDGGQTSKTVNSGSTGNTDVLPTSFKRGDNMRLRVYTEAKALPDPTLGAYTWTNAKGETKVCTAATPSIAITLGQNFDITLPSLSATASGTNIYISSTEGSERRNKRTSQVPPIHKRDHQDL